MKTMTNVAAALLLGAVASVSAQAASVSYFLDQSNKMADGVNYLQVTISDGLNGAIDFKVEALQPLLDVANVNGTKSKAFGIDKFAFNIIPGAQFVKRDNMERPTGFVYGQNAPMDGFGKYDVRLRTTSVNTPIGPTLEFSIIGITLDTLISYVDLALKSDEGPSFFSAHVRGLNLSSECAAPAPQATRFRANTNNQCRPTDAFFGGVQAVPAPAGVWLLGTAIAALAGRKLRKRAQAA